MLREKRGALSQEEVAASIGISRQALARIERGTHRPSADAAVKLAAWLGWPASAVMEAVNAPPGEPIEAEEGGSREFQARYSIVQTARRMGLREEVVDRLVMALDRGEHRRVPPTRLGAAILAKRRGTPLVAVSRELNMTFERLWRLEHGLVKPDASEARALAEWLGWTDDEVRSHA